MLTTSELKALLATTKTIAVVGLSADTSRPSFEVAEVMQRAGYRIIPVNPRYAGQNILGEPCVASLADVKERIDIVDCFRRSEEMVEVAKAAAAVAPLPRVLWMQIGVMNAEAAAIARDAGMTVVQDRCLKLDYQALR
ncbi:MAG TPA: CoA-binding protein [Casimicrobium sp.]|nr:CoA-binding protein [Casimicrobium sp.]